VSTEPRPTLLGTIVFILFWMVYVCSVIVGLYFLITWFLRMWW
jgi:hypothetical protein